MKKAGLLMAMVMLAWAVAQAQTPAGYHLLKKTVLGGEGFWDYLALDNDSRIMYISHGSEVVLLEVDSGKTLAPVIGLQGVHGVAFAPKLGRGFISNGRADTVTVFDLKTRNKLAEIPVGKNPDAILYDDFSGRLFTFNGRGNDTTVINAADNTPAGSIPLGGKPEFAQSDGRGTIFVNIEDTAEIAAIDARALRVTRRWKITPGEEPSGLAIDLKNRRLFSVCANRLLVVSDLDRGLVVATAPIGAGSDGVRFDPQTGLIFSSDGAAGALTVIRQESADHYAVLETIATARGARTLEIDQRTHHVFVVTAEFGPTPAATAENPRPRPAIVPGTFQILEFGK